MATPTATATRAASTFPKTGIGWADNVKMTYSKFVSLTTAQLNTTATIVAMCWLPKNARVKGLMVSAPTQMDSNVAPLLTFDLGDSTSANRYLAASTFAQPAAGWVASSLAATGADYLVPSDQQVLLAVKAAAATAVAGTVQVSISYIIDDTA